jgi:hypothetical protein
VPGEKKNPTTTVNIILVLAKKISAQTNLIVAPNAAQQESALLVQRVNVQKLGDELLRGVELRRHQKAEQPGARYACICKTASKMNTEKRSQTNNKIPSWPGSSPGATGFEPGGNVAKYAFWLTQRKTLKTNQNFQKQTNLHLRDNIVDVALQQLVVKFGGRRLPFENHVFLQRMIYEQKKAGIQKPPQTHQIAENELRIACAADGFQVGQHLGLPCHSSETRNNRFTHCVHEAALRFQGSRPMQRSQSHLPGR